MPMGLFGRDDLLYKCIYGERDNNQWEGIFLSLFMLDDLNLNKGLVFKRQITSKVNPNQSRKSIDNHPFFTIPNLHLSFLYLFPCHAHSIHNNITNLNTCMGTQHSLCTTSSHQVIETDASNTIEFDGEKFILPSTINFDKQATFLKIQSAAKSFCQLNHVNMFYYPLVTRMIAYRHQKVFLSAWARVKEEERDQFLDQLNSIHHDLMDSFYHHYFQRQKGKSSLRKSLKDQKVLTPKQYHVDHPPQKKSPQYIQGRKLILINKVGVVFMLAGSSSRFDLDDKFLTPINLYEKVTILDLMFARLKRNGARTDSMGVALICNQGNFERIRRYMQAKEYYGFHPQNIKIFVSFALPIFDSSGEYCFNSHIRLIKRSSGTANCAEQLFTMGLHDAWKEKGIEYVYFSGGENLLENPCDPHFLGQIVKGEYKAGIKCVKSQFFGELMPRLFSPSTETLKILQSTNFEQLPSGILQKLPIAMNSLILSMQSLSRLSQDYASNISLAGNYQQLKLQCQVFNFQRNCPEMTTCFNFQKDIRYLVTCIKDPLLYRVHRAEEYAPVISKDREYSFNEAIKYYRERLEKELIQLAS